MLQPMTGMLNDPRIRMRLRFLRYYLSAPVLNVDSTPIVLEVRLLPFWAKIRVAAVLVAVAVVAGSAWYIRRNGWGDYQEQAPALLCALAGSVAVWAAITSGAMRLRATFGGSEVQVTESGAGTWNEPLSAYGGVAWLYYKSESFYRLFQIGNKSEYVRLTNPEETYYHWIELRHPNRGKSLVLATGPGEARMRELLERYSKALKQPISGTRVEDDGSAHPAGSVRAAGDWPPE